MVEQSEHAIKTWRYLRIAIVALVVGLVASVLLEHGQMLDQCWQTSISAYFYTPVRGYFVAALVAIGICLFCVRGNTDLEDICLNISGALAPIVAFVPTPLPKNSDGSLKDLCGSYSGSVDRRAIGNNVGALLWIGAFALAALVVVLYVDQRAGTASDLSRTSVTGFALVTSIWFFGLLLFRYGDRDSFIGHAHEVAAPTMFVFIGVAVLINARDAGRPVYRRIYATVAIAMLVAVAVVVAARIISGFPHAVIVVEWAIIGLFAIFWIIQTAELWNDGLRD